MSPSVEPDRPAPEPGGSGPAPQAHTEAESPWTRIKEHKVLQWSLAYLGAALALAHGQELLAHNFGWPELVGHVLIGTLIAGFPIAVALAWYHGHRGMTRMSAGELTVVSLLLVIAAVLLTALVRPGESATEPGVRPLPAQASALSASPATFSTPAAASSKPRIAILPFENLSPDPANAFFTDGLHEEILATLAQQAPGLEVISRTTMLTYRQSPKPLREMARELGATDVIEGSVRRAGKRVRLTLQLIDARTDDHIWAQDYDRTLTDALTLQSDVARQVAQQLSVRLASGSAPSAPLTHDPEAYDLYLKAQLLEDATQGIGTPIEVLRKIDTLLTAALERDREFAAAYARRAQFRMLQFVYNYDPEGRVLALGRQDLAVAERLAPADPLVLFVKGGYLGLVDQDLNGELAAYAAADAAGLADPTSLAVTADAFMRAGRIEEALQRYERAMTLDPRGGYIVGARILSLMEARRPAEALHVLAALEVPETSRLELPRFRDWVLWQFTGNTQALADATSGVARADITASTSAQFLRNRLEVLREQHRYAEMIELIASARTQTLRAGISTAGDEPVAAQRGWVHLLLRDPTAAAADGREVLDFVSRQRETRWNRPLLRLLTAEAYTFTGEKTPAIAAGRDALSLAQQFYERVYVVPYVALVYAWAGAQDDAVNLLEQLATEVPMVVPPATIARDPLFTVPLTGNGRYQALKSTLEAQMAATKLE